MQQPRRLSRPRRFPTVLGLSLALVLAAGTGQAQESTAPLRQQMSTEEFKAAGLDKLSAAELAALEAWLQQRAAGIAVAAPAAAPAPAQAPAAPLAPATAAAPVAPATTTAAVDAAELERIREQAREEGRREVRETTRGFLDFGSAEPISSTLVGEFRGFAKGRQYTLANGQVWEQIEPARLDGVRRQDPKVTIKPGILNVWFLRIDGYNTPAKVRRIR